MDFWLFRSAVGCALEWEYDVVGGRTGLIAIGEELNSMVWVKHLVQEDISGLSLDDGRVSGEKSLYTCHDSCRFSVNIW